MPSGVGQASGKTANKRGVCMAGPGADAALLWPWLKVASAPSAMVAERVFRLHGM
jgi:hypothetical protein